MAVHEGYGVHLVQQCDFITFQDGFAHASPLPRRLGLHFAALGECISEKKELHMELKSNSARQRCDGPQVVPAFTTEARKAGKKEKREQAHISCYDAMCIGMTFP